MARISIVIDDLTLEDATKISAALAPLGLTADLYGNTKALPAGASYDPVQAAQTVAQTNVQTPQYQQAPQYQQPNSYAPQQQAPQAAQSGPNVEALKAAVQAAMQRDQLANGIKLQQLCQHFKLRGILDAQNDPILMGTLINAINQM